jgi:hypothetical protein
MLGEKVHISENEYKGIRFDFPEMKFSFALMSGRLYKRNYVAPTSMPPKSGHETLSTQGIVRQQNYLGDDEEIDTRLFPNKLICECGQIRWVKNADLFQVKKCKPCTYNDRKERRRKLGRR